jgi:Tol biopolymer transport system component
MTPDGRYVVFMSSANNLVAGDTNGMADVFVRDLQADTTTLVSVGALSSPGAVTLMGMPAISPDGRFVAFFSTAKGLVPAASVGANGEVYVCDLVAGQMAWASTNAAALVQATLGVTNVMSYHPVISSDGRYLAFKTGAVNATSAAAILVYDCTTATTAVISTNSFPVLPDQEDPYGPEMTPDGRYVAYVQREGSGTQTYSSVHLWDRQTATDILVSSNGGWTPTNAISQGPLASPDGRFVAFLSNATNLAPNPVLPGFHLYLRDLQSGATSLADADLNGIGSTDNELSCFNMSANGRWIAFSSPDGNLTARDFNGACDVFVRDTAGSTTELVSARDLSVQPPSASGGCFMSQRAVSANGRCIAFSSSIRPHW